MTGQGNGLWRRWRWALAVLAFAVACSTAWAAFVWFRVTEHPGGTVPAGQAWTSPEGYRAELVTFRVTDTLVDEDGRRRAPVKGTQWVYIEMQFHGMGPDTPCGLKLSGTGGKEWTQPFGAPQLKGFTYCGEDGAGPDPLVHQTFQVPREMVPQVQGVLLDHSMMLRQPPLFARP